MRRLQVVAALLLCALTAASCRAILGTDGYESSADALCELLLRCYKDEAIPACNVSIGDALTQAGADARASWLAAFSDASCLESCASARRCLDLQPVCDDKKCDVREDCCGFLGGRADCDEERRVCCAPKGIACNTQRECCSGVADCINGICGGVPCKPADAACTKDSECCTNLCRKGACAVEICAPNNFNCGENLDCCSKFCDPVSHTCTTPQCLTELEPCAEDGQPCCGQLECAVQDLTTGARACVLGCLIEGDDCANDDQCCGHRCDLLSFKCKAECSAVGAMCAKDEECCTGLCAGGACSGCLPKDASCAAGAECCSGSCVGNTCMPVCKPPSCTHDECVGTDPSSPPAPLSKECSGLKNPQCVLKVCAQDPYCCCTNWDSLCASEAHSLCTEC